MCGIEYDIIEGDDMMTHTGPKDPGDGVVRGAVNPWRALIIIDQSLAKDQKELTFLHELIHAVDDAQRLDLTEEQTGLLATGLYSVRFKGPRKRDKVRTIKGVFYG